MAKSETYFEDSHGKNKEQTKRRKKRQRRFFGVKKGDTNKVWLRTRRRVRRGLLDR